MCLVVSSDPGITEGVGKLAKAQELLKQGHSYLDRDGDGEACKSLR